MSALKRIFSLPYEVISNRKLIFSLSKNDFKTRFAGSYLGIIWAFVQPIVTVLVYWFVFEKGLKANGINTKEGIEIQFVLWFVAALMPWFFFAEAWGNATNALLEYSYLVKKVVFKISILPIVKIISALYVHIFFIAFVVILFACYGYYPDVYYIQIIYYSLCMFFLALGLGYITSAVVVFFKDLNQIISIILQIGMWLTPIMWNIDGIGLSEQAKNLFKLNPMYYVTSGYRDTFINEVWFFEHPWQTLYFWSFTAIVFFVGAYVFKKLKVHFADVL